MASSSSTKKAARLAQKGKGRKVRFQGGTVFPAAVALTLILGLALIVYSRQSLPAADETPPTIDDHWHAAYGFYLCDGWYMLNGNAEELDSQGQLINRAFLRTGIHSHDDGVIHWHPYTSAAVGKNAVIGVFLETYGVELNDDSIVFPSLDAIGLNPDYLDAGGSNPPQLEFVEGETTCNGEDAEVSVKVWDRYSDTGNGQRYIKNMDRIHVDQNSMVFGIYFTPRDADQVMPPWAQDLPQLGAADSDQFYPEIEDLLSSDASTPAGDGSTDTSSTDGSSTDGSSTDGSSTDGSSAGG